MEPTFRHSTPLICYGNTVLLKIPLRDLEDSLLYELDSRQLQNYFTSEIEVANWGRKLAEKQMIFLEKRLIIFQFYNAGDRYINY